MIKAFLDSNVFITSFEDEYSNSHLVLKLANGSHFKAIISQHVINEVKGYIERLYSKNLANDYIYQIKSIPILKIVNEKLIKEKARFYEKLISDKDDIPHITACIMENCDYFVTVNRKLTQMKAKKKINFVSQQEFVEILGMRSINTPIGE